MDDEVQIERPRRADARRNAAALVAAARVVFAEEGGDAPLDRIAMRAGVGIATLYRNFPTRADLVEAVYLDEVESVCAAARAAGPADPWEALVQWLGRVTGYIATKHALMDQMARDSAVLPNCRDAIHEAATPLFRRAQEAGAVRDDVTVQDMLWLVSGLASARMPDEAQRARLLSLALDGLRPR